MATDYSQLTPEQQSAIAKYAAATYGTSPKALGMVQQKLASDPAYANQQLQRFGYKVGVDTEGVNQFNPMAEGMSYDQDIRNSLAVDEPEAVHNAKEEKKEQAGSGSGGKNGRGGGTPTAKGSLPVPSPKPGGVNGPGTSADAIAAPVSVNNRDKSEIDTAGAAVAAGAAGAGLAAWLVKNKGMDPAAASRVEADMASKPELAARNPTVQEFLAAAGQAPRVAGPQGATRLAQPQEDMGVPPNIVDGEFTEQRALPGAQPKLTGPDDEMVNMIMQASRGAGAVPPPATTRGVAPPNGAPAGTPLLPPPPDGGTPMVPPAPPRQPIPGAGPDAMISQSLNQGGGDVQAAMGRAKMLLDAGTPGPQVMRQLAGEFGPEVVQQVMQAASQAYPQARMPITAGVDTPPSEALDAGLKRVIGRGIR